ncbi:MAG: DHH family phosphoesterase [Bacilli bacterium]|nr:DHH family phosphoesterase [Bacilli bacterium]
MIVITVGKSYIDIDGYASSIAYRELLRMKGIESKFVSNAVLNYSITYSLKSIPYSVDDYWIDFNDKYIILDLSNKSFFPEFVDENNIVEIIDHHPGFEDYWNNILGDNAIIELIGSVATIIIERYEQEGLLDRMDKDIAKLLMAAILDNTLNFTANITTSRDRIAYKKLESLINEYDYASTYFSECQKYIEDNLQESIKNDMKVQRINECLPEVFGQLTIWDAEELLHKRDFINQIMNGYGNKWMLNIISLSNNSSYIIYSNDEIKSKLRQLLDCYDKNGSLIISPAMLRKEIMRKALIANSK